MPSDSARAACIAKSAFVLSGSLPALRRTTQTKTMTTQPISTDLSVYGYARVSTTDQSLDIQIAALKVAGCEKIRSDSATSTNGRQELKTLLEFIDAGDVLIVTRIDRLARSIGDLQDIVRALKAKGVALRATEQPIDTSTAAGKADLKAQGFGPSQIARKLSISRASVYRALGS